jgi:hypothetical protein
MVRLRSSHSLGLVKLLYLLLDGLEDVHVLFDLLGLLRGLFHIKLIKSRSLFLIKRGRMIFFDFNRLRG